MSGSTTPYPIGEVKNLQDALSRIQQYFDEMYQERVGGALIGDVFQVGDDETLSVKLSPGGCIQKTNGALSVFVDPNDSIETNASGLRLLDTTKDKHGACPKLPDDAAKYLNGKGAWISPTISSWPVGSVYLSVLATDPATLLGFGTWERVAEGQMLVGFKTGDADFGTAEGTGGAKTATHTNNHAVSQPTAHGDHPTGTAATGAGVTVVTAGTHTNNHAGTAVTAHGDHNILNPFFTIYIWKRTA